MPVLRQAAATSTDLACRVAGRQNIVRAARFVLCRARLDIPNDPRTNGESFLQRWVADSASGGRRFHVIDVGANVGCWSKSMLGAASLANRIDSIDLHAFEPSAYTFALLSAALEGRRSVQLNNLAVSDRIGRAALHVVAQGAGRNSLHMQSNPGPAVITEEITTTTLDSYAAGASLDHIDFIKVDTEGHDLAVLRGANALLRDQRISAIQFEYNHRWIDARSYLRDAFALVELHGYLLGKLTPRAVEFYPGWDPDLETFVEGNYVACLPETARRLPTVTWWKSLSKGTSACS